MVKPLCTATIILVVLLGTARSDSLIDLNCRTDAECEMFKNGTIESTCSSNGTCECILQESKNKTECMPVATKTKWSMRIGGMCPCLAENSFCNESTQLCVCKDGFLPSREARKCISKSVPLGQACEIDEQCVLNDHFSHCDDALKNCTCSNHFVAHQNVCLSIIASGDVPCQQDSDCTLRTNNTFCHERQCICKKGFVANAENTTCLAQAYYDQECSDSNQCILQLGIGSLCIEGKCGCNEQHFAFPIDAHNSSNEEHKKHVLCQRKITHLESCNNNKECYQLHRGPEEQSMECFMNQCICAKDFVARDGNCVNINRNAAQSIYMSPLIVFIVSLTVFGCKQLFTC